MSRLIRVADHDAGLSAKIAFFFTKWKLAADGWSGNWQNARIAAAIRVCSILTAG